MANVKTCDKVCAKCGKLMKNVAANKVYCPECRRERNLLYDKRFRIRKAAGLSKKYKTRARFPSVKSYEPAPTPVENDPVSKDAAEAQRLGYSSYGKYSLDKRLGRLRQQHTGGEAIGHKSAAPAVSGSSGGERKPAGTTCTDAVCGGAASNGRG